jgi:hypothetical protein
LVVVFETGEIGPYDLRQDNGKENELAQKIPEITKKIYGALKDW